LDTLFISKNTVPNISSANTYSTQISKLKNPQIKLKDNIIILVLPSNDNQLKRWEIQVITTPESLVEVITTEKDFYILDWQTLSVTVIDVDFNISYEFNLWHEKSRNRLLFFSETGDFIYSGSFGDGEIQFETGKYTILSRLKFTTKCKEIQSDIYMFQLNLFKGKIENISNGFVTLVIKSDSIPSITWTGKNIKSNEGHEVFASKDLQLIVNLSEKGTYILKITSSLGKAITLDIDGNSSQFYEIDIANQLNDWKSGLTKLTAVLFRKNTKIELAKNNLFLWNELNGIDSELNFYFSSAPSNLNTFLSKNIVLLTNKLTYLSRDTHQFSFIFDLPLDKKLTLTFKIPELFLDLEEKNVLLEAEVKSVHDESELDIESDQPIFSATKLFNTELENINAALNQPSITPIIPEGIFMDKVKDLAVIIVKDEETDKFEGMF